MYFVQSSLTSTHPPAVTPLNKHPSNLALQVASSFKSDNVTESLLTISEQDIFPQTVLAHKHFLEYVVVEPVGL